MAKPHDTSTDKSSEVTNSSLPLTTSVSVEPHAPHRKIGSSSRVRVLQHRHSMTAGTSRTSNATPSNGVPNTTISQLWRNVSGTTWRRDVRRRSARVRPVDRPRLGEQSWRSRYRSTARARPEPRQRSRCRVHVAASHALDLIPPRHRRTHRRCVPERTPHRCRRIWSAQQWFRGAGACDDPAQRRRHQHRPSGHRCVHRAMNRRSGALTNPRPLPDRPCQRTQRLSFKELT